MGQLYLSFDSPFDALSNGITVIKIGQGVLELWSSSRCVWSFSWDHVCLSLPFLCMAANFQEVTSQTDAPGPVLQICLEFTLL